MFRTTCLINLPPEVLLEISDHLPMDALLALKLTHQTFNELLPLDPRRRSTAISDCAHHAIRAYLKPKATRLRCALCKTVYPADIFKCSSSPMCVSSGAQQTEVVALPGRVCSWHVGRLARIVHTDPGGRNKWVAHVDHMCMHCGAIQKWGKCACKCDSCALKPINTYTRYLNNNRECKNFVFWRDTSTPNPLKLWVRENCWDPGANNHLPTINMPVHFEPGVTSDYNIAL